MRQMSRRTPRSQDSKWPVSRHDQAGIKIYPKPQAFLNSNQELGQAVERDKLLLIGLVGERGLFPES